MNQSLPETRAPSAGAPGEVDRQQAPAQASREAKDGRRQHADGSKAIVLFSDGTGNSSAKLFKTNVWRMYEAVDLGPSSEEKRPQIAFYDNGVGTSALRPLAALGGIFGFGLKRNILEIYRYACRNYQAGPDQKPGADPVKGGDEIYGFGFSRGAFTMRLVIALIASQGLVVSSDEAELERKSKDAYRAFRADFEPRKLKWPTRLFRAAREWLSRKWRRRRGVPLYDSADNLRPEIRFVGVFDTVAAYGGPVTEITRAIDNWLYALSMPDYQLNERVRCARHALAIDDERDAFHPLLWDEVHEASLISDAKVSKDRLRQVWFTGMHADVGGGYPDESLSYVSLLWMIKEAEDQGLRVLKVITDRFLALASSSGPIHDSRSGPGAYYRYQPRKIAAWMQPPDPSTLYQRDPDRVDPNGASLGFIPTVLVHESVAARIAHGTDRYAPITLPARIVIVPPKAGGETALQADTVTPKAEAAADDGAVRPLLDPWLHDRFENAAFGAERVAKMERVWDLVWRRRIAYFLTLGLTLLLVLLPLWVSRTRDPPFLADGRTWLGEIIRLLNIILPQFLEGWVNTAAANSFYVLVLGVLILAIMGRSAAMEGQLRDHARAIWAHSLSPDRREPEVQKSAWRLRTSPHYQWWMQKAKWLVLPALFGLVMLGLLLWVALGLLTQTRLPGLERSGLLCPKRSSVAGTNAASLDFSPRSVCEAALMNVVRGERYLVTLDVVEPWKDSKVDAAPTGLAAGELGFPWGYIGVPLRRIVNAGYLQPAYLIRSRRAWWQFGEPVYIQPISLQQQGDAATSWQAEFTAERDGELSLFANDSILPFELGRYNYRYFYEQSGSGRGNSGSACVTIMRADRISLPPPPRTPACLLAAQRAAAAAKAELQPTRSASPRRPAARPAGARPPA